MNEEITINPRLKLAALWTAAVFCYLYGDYFELYLPKKVEGLLTGHNLLDSPMKLWAASIMMSVSAVMIPVSVMASRAWCRRLNLIAGIFFTAIMVLIGAMSVSAWRTFYVYLAVVESVLTSVIVWQAWRLNVTAVQKPSA